MSSLVKKFQHQEVERKWQQHWSASLIDSPDICNAGKPYYNLMMFPYPSAEGLHVGNMYAFCGSDIFGRYMQMQGFDVFEPIGLDGFGMHSENFAFKVGRHPMDHATVTQKNFYIQLHKIGAMFDWSRTLETYDPKYYQWTQWLFTQMFKHGLAYRAKAKVNFCPSCKTVLADEQVIDGACERCGKNVEDRSLEQWFFRITAKAEQLLSHIPALDWSEKIKITQTNWIGKKTGINITYPVINESDKDLGTLTCFTTRPDTNLGATFVAVAPEHPFVTRILEVTENRQRRQISSYLEAVKNRQSQQHESSDREKTGVFTGLYCVNQLNNIKMPLYISDFVLTQFGSGAVVGVPGHDTRDFEFAKAMKLPVKRVVVGDDGDTGPIARADQVQEATGRMINSEFLDGLEVKQAISQMTDHLVKKGWGKRVTTYHLRDWLVSRQRYWGAPIPMIYCQLCAAQNRGWLTSEEAKQYQGVSIMYHGKNPEQIHNTNSMIRDTSAMPGWTASNASRLWRDAGWYPVPEDQLPVILPRIEDYKPGDDGVAPLAKHKEFYQTKCPGCGGAAVRETDVCDTFLDSSWYFLRYPSLLNDGATGRKKNSVGSSVSLAEGSQMPPLAASRSQSEDAPNFSSAPHQEGSLPFDPLITKKWLPVHMYTGGAEHSVLHLLYSRFVTMALHDFGYINFDEPFTRFFAHGLIIKDGAKMSKSKGNVVNPDQYIASYGADALRLYLMFMGPFSQGGDFRDEAMEGMSRWVGRVFRMARQTIYAPAKATGRKPQESIARLEKALESLIQRVGDDTAKRRYNTAIALMMEFTNLVSDVKAVLPPEMLKKFLLILAPYAPFITEELWQELHGRKDSAKWQPADSIHRQKYPAFDPAALANDQVELPVQVAGKLRHLLTLTPAEAKDGKKVEDEARKSVRVAKYLAQTPVKKVIFVPGKLINFVV